MGHSIVIVDGLIYSTQLNTERGEATIRSSLEDVRSMTSKSNSVADTVENSVNIQSNRDFNCNDKVNASQAIRYNCDYVRQWTYQFPNKFANSKYEEYDTFNSDSCCVLRFATLVDSNDAQIIKDMICRFFLVVQQKEIKYSLMINFKW